MRAGAIAGILSGIPSTAVSVARGWDPLQATEAAGTILLPREHRRKALLLAAIPVHGAISVAWAIVMTLLLPSRRPLLWGGAWGLAIAAFDLGVMGRRLPRIRALPLGPQVADHLAYGVIAAACIERSRQHAATVG